MARWYNKVEDAACHSFNVIAATFHGHYDESLNFYNNLASNALVNVSMPRLRGCLTSFGSLFSDNSNCKNKAFMLSFSTKAFVISKIFSKFGLQLNN